MKNHKIAVFFGLVVLAGIGAWAYYAWFVHARSMDMYHSTMQASEEKVCDDSECWMEDVYRVQITRRWYDESPPRDEIMTRKVAYEVWDRSHNWVRGEVLDNKPGWGKL